MPEIPLDELLFATINWRGILIYTKCEFVKNSNNFSPESAKTLKYLLTLYNVHIILNIEIDNARNKILLELLFFLESWIEVKTFSHLCIVKAPLKFPEFGVLGYFYLLSIRKSPIYFSFEIWVFDGIKLTPAWKLLFFFW